MIPIEVEEPNPQVIFRSTSSQALQEEADLANEVRKMARVREKC